MAKSTLLLGLLANTCSLAIAYEPSPLQDFCVAEPTSSSEDFDLLIINIFFNFNYIVLACVI